MEPASASRGRVLTCNYKKACRISDGRWRGSTVRYLHIQIVMLLPTPNSVSLDRIMSAYTDDRIFSVELVGAVRRITVLSLDTDIIEQVLRQGSFINRMHKIGWTEPSYFNKASAKVSLQQCVARYHGYGFFLFLLEMRTMVLYLASLISWPHLRNCFWYQHQILT